jgi:hypothetical protein
MTCILPVPARPCAGSGHWEVETTDFSAWGNCFGGDAGKINLSSTYFLSAMPMVLSLRKKQKQEKAFIVMPPSSSDPLAINGDKEENTAVASALLEANSDLERAEGGGIFQWHSRGRAQQQHHFRKREVRC